MRGVGKQLLRWLLLTAVMAHSPAFAQTLAGELTIGSVFSLPASEEEKVLELQLIERQGVIVELTAVVANAGDTPAPPTLRINDPAGQCVRALAPSDSCPAGSIAPELEAGAAPDTVRVALRAATAGTYKLVLTLPPAGSLARYELLVRERPLPEPVRPSPVSLCILPRPEDPASDRCAQSHTLDESGRAYFEFTASEPEQWVQIDMRSDTLDSVVELLGPLDPGAPVELAPQIIVDDDGGGDRNARLRAQLPAPGVYAVLARSYSGGTGSYSLAVRALEPPPERAPVTIAPGQRLSDAFTGQELVDFHSYNLVGHAGDTIVVEVRSALDTRLDAGFEMNVFDASTAQAQDFASLAVNDDTCGLDPQLKLRFREDETVQVRVGLVGGIAAGDYTISARAGDAAGCPAEGSAP